MNSDPPKGGLSPEELDELDVYANFAMRLPRRLPFRTVEPTLETFPCGECGKTVTPRQRHTIYDCRRVGDGPPYEMPDEVPR